MLDRLEPLFRSLNFHGVEYLVIGGVAAIAYGVPRLTVDVDFLIDPTPANAKALLAALLEAGLGTAALTTAEDVLRHEITIFRDRIRVDVQTKTPGIDFREESRRRNTVLVGATPVHLVSLDGLIRAKTAAALPRDLEDVKILEAARPKPEHPLPSARVGRL